MTQEELDEAIAKHVLWLNKAGGRKLMLHEADLSRLSLIGANLRKAIITNTKLHCANLSEANLADTDLTESIFDSAKLSHAILTRAVVMRADLSGADLCGADLSGAILQRATLRSARLCGANCYAANFSHANLINANLSHANLCQANLTSANISGADLTIASGAVARLDFGRWSVCVREDSTTIGCQEHPNEDWLSWKPDSRVIADMDNNAPDWWRVHGAAVKAVIRCVMSKAVKETKNDDDTVRETLQENRTDE